MASTLQFQEIQRSDWPSFHDRVVGLEAGITYPLGEDRFEIDHGADYAAFFDRLGDFVYYAVLDGEQVVAGAGAILRKVPKAPGEKPRKGCNGCDLKVIPSHRGERIPWRIVKHAFLKQYLRCGRGYGITMNPGDGSPNPVVRMAGRFWLGRSTVATTIHFFSFDRDAMAEEAELLEHHRGPLSYLSLEGKKDIVLQSTGAAMPLLHVQFGPCAAPGHPAPLPDHVHMFCVPEEDPLLTDLTQRGHSPHASASVLQHRMKGWDWRFILTSDI